MPNDKSFKKKIEQINELISDIEELPTLSAIAFQVMKIAEDPSSSAADMAKIVSLDQVLTTRILRLVNSAFYSFPGSITTVNLAISILGMKMARDVIVSASFMDLYTDEKEGDFSRTALWEHSIGCGVACRMLARIFRYRVPGEVFVAGLIHDIGKVILDRILPEELSEIREIVQREEVSFLEAENKVLGLNHAEIGKYFAQKWSLPEILCESIGFHHNPSVTVKNPQLTSIVHLGNILCRAKGVGSGWDYKIPKIDKFAWDTLKTLKLDLNETDINKFLYELDADLEKAKVFSQILYEHKTPDQAK